jgi:23S rRNA (guanosine2251-2'-O)-methyltransferase
MRAKTRPPRPATVARPAPDRFWLWGQQAVAAALANPGRPCHRLLATEPALQRLGHAAERPGLVIEKTAPDLITKRLGVEPVHQGLALEVGSFAAVPLDAVLQGDAPPRLILALDQVSDPRNLGAILRSAAAFEVGAVILPERRSAELGGVAAKAASGAVDLLPLIEVVNLAKALEQAKAAGYWVVGLDAHGAETLATLPAHDRLVLVLGAEGAGLRRLVAERCDHLVRLPISGRIESLNVSVAAGIALHALAGPDAGSRPLPEKAGRR